MTREDMLLDPARDEQLILVDGLDRMTGTATKWEAHAQGLLHRAFSAVLVREGDTGAEVLLSQRAMGKYHSGGLWANSCCSHPRAGAELLDEAVRRVREELGCEAADLREIGAFVYRAEFENGLAEHEYDHVLVGRMTGELMPDPTEVSATRWVGVEELAAELAREPRHFSAWAPMVLSIALREICPRSYSPRA